MLHADCTQLEDTMKNVALITGASSGIGYEIAKVHAQNGGDMVIVSRTLADLEKVKAEIQGEYGVEVVCIAKDFAVGSAVSELYEEIKAQNIDVEYLVNNAGFGDVGLFAECDWQKNLDMIQVNIVALCQLVRLFLPDFLAKDSGRILNISSIAGLAPGPMQSVYYATKAFVNSFSEAISGEVEGTNVTVTALLPCAVKTKFGATSGMDKIKKHKEAVEADLVARDSYRAMMAGKISAMSGVKIGRKIVIAISPMVPKRVVLRYLKKRASK